MEAGRELSRMQVGGAGKAGRGRQYGDRDQAGGAGDVVVDRGSRPGVLGRTAARTVEVSGATLMARPRPKTSTAGSTSVR